MSTEVQIRTSDGWTSTATATGDLTSGTPVVLLHGLSQQRRFWDPVRNRLGARPAITIDQRGHGDSSADAQADYSIPRCALDVIEFMDSLGIQRVQAVGHSWGASVALHLAANWPDRVEAAALIDGGLWMPPGATTSRAEVLERLRPPVLGIPESELWERIGSGGLSGYLTDEVRAALAPTYDIDDEGLARTRIGMDRHMAVLGGMLDYDPWSDAEQLQVPVWVAFCEPRDTQSDPVRLAAIARASALPTSIVHQWAGAIHDVPLQWPMLVAGFIDAMLTDRDAEKRGGLHD